MEPKIIRVIAPLPPKANVAARHAGRVIYHLDTAGFDIRPATTVGPAYSLDQLRFAPKAKYIKHRARLLTALNTLVLYPEGLDFGQISQPIWWHRWLERYRRFGLVWRLLWRAKKSVVVFRPRLLKKPDHLAIVLLAGLAKILHPARITLIRQKTPPESLVKPLLGRQPAPVSLEASELANLMLAAKQGAKEVGRLTPLWVQAAFNRLPESDPLFQEIRTLNEVVAQFAEEALPVLKNPAGFITQAPFKNAKAPAVHGVKMTEYMLHFRQAKRLTARFPLNTKEDAEAYRSWFLCAAPTEFSHAMLRDMPPDTNWVQTPKSTAAALKEIIANARFFDAEKAVPTALKTWLNTAIFDNVTRLEFLLATLAHAPLPSVQSLQKPWKEPAISTWFAAHAFASYPALAGLADLPIPATKPVLLTTGEGAADTGLGQNRTMSENALKGLTPKRRLCLHHVNADAIPAQMLRCHTPETTHIGFLLWELEALPEAHILAGKVLDEVWVPSRFVQRIYQQAYDIPVTWVGKGFDLPPPATFDLARLGICPEQPTFLLSFDLHSSVARKNPLAAVHAFQMAFEGNPEARLIIKTSKPPKKHWGDPEKQMSIIKKLMARDRRIILFQEHLPFAEYLGLIKAATALVSPHRAEGFGYVPAYAMALGTPVIATDYAGTQDFCTTETALVVPWRKRLVRPGESIFPLKNTHWAEIDHDALAIAMQDIQINPVTAAQRAAKGKALMRETYSQAALRQRYIKRLTALGLI